MKTPCSLTTDEVVLWKSSSGVVVGQPKVVDCVDALTREAEC